MYMLRATMMTRIINNTYRLQQVRSSSAAGSRVELLLRQLGRQFHQETCLKTYEDAGKPGSCLVASTALGIDWFVPNPVVHDVVRTNRVVRDAWAHKGLVLTIQPIPLDRLG